MQEIITQQIVNVVRTNPDHPAIWVDGMYYTYNNFINSAFHLSQLFRAISTINSRCAIFADKNINAYRSIMATLLAGKAYMPLSTTFPLEKNLRIIEEGQPELICIDRKKHQDVIDLLIGTRPIHVVLFDEALFKKVSQAIPKHQYYLWTAANEYSNDLMKANMITPSGDAYAYLLFTSGSTGQPKGIAVNHANLMHFINVMRELCELKHEDRCVQLVELTFDLSVHDMFVCWASGATLYVVPEHYTFGIKKFIQTHQLTSWLSVPSTITLLDQLGQLNSNVFPSIKKSLFCGEVFLESQAKQWQLAAPNTEIINLYGPTEATVAFTFYQWTNETNKHGSSVIPIGRPFNNLSCVLINDDESVCKNDIGELCLSGPQVVKKYWNNANKSSQQFKKFTWDNDQHLWYRTGDLAKWDPIKGYLFMGRIDDQWQIRGYRVEKLEIENEIRRVTGHDSVAVVPHKSKEGTVLDAVAFIGGDDISADVLTKKLRSVLPDVMVPKKIICLPSLPKNSNGKTDYVHLSKLIN